MKASVVIAAMNAQDTVADAVRSVLNQTLEDLEVIVVDDASVDRTRDVVRAIAAADARVTLLENEVNLRVSRSRNRGLDAARGDWIAILDADDTFAPPRLRRLIERAEASGLDMLGDNLCVVDHATKARLGPAFGEEDFDPRARVTPSFMIERDGPEAPGNWNFGYVKPIIARAFLREHGLRYQDDVWCAEDFLLYFDCLLAGARFGLTPEALYEHRAGNMASLSRRASVDREVSRVNRLLVERARARGRPDLMPLLLRRQRLLDNFAFFNAIHYGRYREAVRCLPAVPADLALREVLRRLKRSVVRPLRAA